MKQEIAKHATDAASVGVVAATLTDLLPAIASLFTIIWMGIRIIETRTVQRLWERWKK